MTIERLRCLDVVARILDFFEIDTSGMRVDALRSYGNELFNIVVNDGEYVLRISPPHSRVPLDVELAVHDQLRATDVSIRSWYRNSRGQRVAETTDGYAMLADYIPGTVLDPAIAADCHAAGRALALIHLAPLRIETANPLSLLSLAAIDKALAWSGDLTTARHVRTLIAAAASSIAAWPNLPIGVLHGDYHCGNVIVSPSPQRRLSILDFERCTTGPYVFDVARGIAGVCCIGGRVAASRLVPFLDGYRSGRKLSPVEFDQLRWWVCASCAVLATWAFDHSLDALVASFLETGASCMDGELL